MKQIMGRILPDSPRADYTVKTLVEDFREALEYLAEASGTVDWTTVSAKVLPQVGYADETGAWHSGKQGYVLLVEVLDEVSLVGTVDDVGREKARELLRSMLDQLTEE